MSLMQLMKFAFFASVDIIPWCMGRGAPRCHPRGPGLIKDEISHVHYTGHEALKSSVKTVYAK